MGQFFSQLQLNDFAAQANSWMAAMHVEFLLGFGSMCFPGPFHYDRHSMGTRGLWVGVHGDQRY